MYVVPLEGRSVPDPLRGDLLPISGREVDQSNYWCRRISDGDVKVTDTPAVTIQEPAVSQTVTADTENHTQENAE